MTGQELEPVRLSTDSWIGVIGPVGHLARDIAKTEFVPAALRNKPDAVAAAILTGRELGLSPLTALRGINIIDGRPSLSAELLAAKILAAGHKVEWLESTEQKASVRIVRGDGLSEATAEWSMRDADRAGLLNKQNWRRYPRAMLRHRALTEASGMACPDVSLGLETDWQPETLAPEPGARTVRVQATRQTRQEPPRTPPEPEAEVVEGSPVSEPQEAPTEPEADPAASPVTPEQLKRMHAIVTEMQRMSGKRLTAADKRAFIVRHAGLDDSAIESLKELTEEQAGWAIASLSQARNLMQREMETAQEGPPF